MGWSACFRKCTRCLGARGGDADGWSVSASTLCIPWQPHSSKALPRFSGDVYTYVVGAKSWQLARPGLSCHGVAPSPAGVDDPSRRWLDRAAEARVVWVRVRGVRLHGPALCCPHFGSTHPLPLGAPVGVSGPDGTSRRCHHPANCYNAALSAPGCQRLRQFLWRSASIATSQSPTTIRGDATCSPRRSNWSSP